MTTKDTKNTKRKYVSVISTERSDERSEAIAGVVSEYQRNEMNRKDAKVARKDTKRKNGIADAGRQNNVGTLAHVSL